MRVPIRKKTKKKLKPKTREARERNMTTRNKKKTTRERENEWKTYLKLVTCWIAYMYNVALNIKTLST